MKTNVRISIWAMLFLTAFALHAQNSGPSTNGSFVISSPTQPIEIEFNARLLNNGSTTGEMTFGATVELSEQDVDGEGNGSGSGVVDLDMTVNVDCLRIAGNKAVFSGEITQSSQPAYVGRRALLAVEDNGEGKKTEAPDRFMWGLYGVQTAGWVPTDAELAFDPGAGLFWFATDAEREDDVGIPSHPNANVDCKTFPLTSYSFEDLPHGAGNIQVKP